MYKPFFAIRLYYSMNNNDELSVNENSVYNKKSDLNGMPKGKDDKKDIVSSGTSFEKPLDKKDIYSKSGDQARHLERAQSDTENIE